MTTLEDRIARLEALVERQAAIIVEKDAQIARLSRRIEELERRLGERDGGGSEPPQSGEGKPREPSGRKPGGQPGHKGHRRKMVSPDQVTRTEECFPDECRGCGEKLAQTADASPVLHQVVEIPELRPDVTEFRLHRVKCACGTTTCGALPTGTPRGMMGPRLVAFVALLSANCHVSRRKVRQLLKDVLGIDIALGTLSESEALATAAVEAPVREALQSALAAPVKHADGTTWYRHHDFRSLWVLATRSVTVFTTFESGTKAALSQWLGHHGILVSDRGTQLGFWSMRRRQICWAHLLRKFAWYAAQDVEAANIGRALLTYARNVLHEWHRVRDGHITRATAARNTAPARDVIELLLGSGLKVPSIAGSCAHILEHRAALWTFFARDGVEPTNNHAERELRVVAQDDSRQPQRSWRRVRRCAQVHHPDLSKAGAPCLELPVCCDSGPRRWSLSTATRHARPVNAYVPAAPPR